MLHLAQIQREGWRDDGGVETEGERDEEMKREVETEGERDGEMKRERWRQRERGMKRCRLSNDSIVCDLSTE